MIMDIRKYFTSPKNVSSSTSNTSSDKKIKNSSKNTEESKIRKKRRVIESDSDEDPIPKEKKDAVPKDTIPKGKKDAESKDTKSPKAQNIKSFFKHADAGEKLKKVTVSDFFGLAPVARNEKKDSNKIEKKESVHEDDDFESTLKELSEKPKNGILESEPVKESKKTKSPPQPKNQGKGSKKRPLSDISFEKKETVQTKTVVVDEKPPPPKKPKGNAGYASYLNREGPKALGSKEIPEGADGCLAGLTFIVTGVLESIERDEAKSLIEKYGGKVMTTITKNTKYIVIGRDAGASKLDKAEKFGTKQLDEDGLFDLIRTLPGKNGLKSPASSKKTPEPKPKAKAEEKDEKMTDPGIEIEDVKMSETKSPKTDYDSADMSEKDIIIDDVKSEDKSKLIPTEPKKSDKQGFSMWVDKYKPSSIKQIVGQQGDKSNAKKLLEWLKNWSKNRKLNKKPMAPGRWNAADDGSGYKAALLSGPPGVGKTTTAQLVCKETGFDFFELNASDQRSKKCLQQSVSELLKNQTLSDCFSGEPNGKVTSRHVIIMDEVDGMAGNEDRGGMRELIDFIKASKIPIICICNDRNHPKIRSLSNYCFDLRFQRPRVEQIKAAMMSVAFKEGIKVSPNALQDVIVASNQDIRQVLHNMSMWSAKTHDMTAEQTKADVGKGTKHIKLGPFDVLREVFAIGNNPKASFNDKSALFFHDYSIAPLFVHENYVHVIPTAAQGDKKKHMTLLSEAADSICIGDMIDKIIRNNNSWSLLPTQALFASVVPGELLAGNLRQMINFPAWLGKNSNRNYMNRILQELHVHMRMKITGNKTDVNLEYLPLLKNALTKPLMEKEQDGVPEALSIMEQYYLLREDFDTIIDLSLWPNQTDPRTKISPKVKSAFTRAYNKECGKNPYAVTNVKKKKGAAKDLDEDNEDEIEESEEEKDNIQNDAMIKVKKPSKKNASAASEASTSKEKKSRKGKTK